MPTLRDYRQHVARELGAFLASTVSSGSTTTSLVDLAYPVHSTLAQDGLWQDAFLLRPDAALTTDRVRLVKTYTPADGALQPDLPWTNAPTADEVYELHTVLEPATEFGAALAEALGRCLLVVECSLTPTPGATRQLLPGWLVDPRWVREVGWLAAGDARDAVDPFQRVVRGQAIADGDALYLEHPGWLFQATDTLVVRALKPAITHCAPSGGAFGEQVGLTHETDACPVDLEWAAAGALVAAWRRSSQALEAASRERVLRTRQEAAATFTRLTRQRLDLPPRTFQPLRSSGVGRWLR